MMKLSSITRAYPTFRDEKFKNSHKWLQHKQIDDNAEKLWRVHDKLYDLTNFIDRHPGGSDWIALTKGTDITEAFETHHMNENEVVKILKKYYVRDARLPRNYKLTFHPDGFYKTLKRRAFEKLKTQVDQNPHRLKSKIFCDLVFAAMILSFIWAARDFNYITASLAVLFLFTLTIISHNFLHQRDNWRMYLVNFNTQNFREWRIFHAMSHHMYPNSFHDLECSSFEPYLNWMPEDKVSHLYQILMSLFIYMKLFALSFIYRIVGAFKQNYSLHWDDLLPFSIPVMMYFIGNYNLTDTFIHWYVCILLTSFCYGFFAINAGHHHNKAFHDGDELSSMDYGVYQLSATFDRAELQNSQFITLASFGHHISHHFFPTLDHSVLPELTETIYETCKEFETELKVYPWFQLVIGQFKQLGRVEKQKIN